MQMQCVSSGSEHFVSKFITIRTPFTVRACLCRDYLASEAVMYTLTRAAGSPSCIPFKSSRKNYIN